MGLGCIAGFFPGVSPFAHLSNLKLTDPTVPRTRGLGTPARRRRCRAAGPARAPRTRPSWSCCPRPTWTWGAERGCVSRSPLPPPHHPEVSPACHFGVTSADAKASKPHGGGVLRPGFAPELQRRPGHPDPEQPSWWPKLESFLDIQGQCSPEGGSCVSGE